MEIYHNYGTSQWLWKSWWRHQMETFSHYFPFVRIIHRWPVNSQWHGALIFYFFYLRPNKRRSRQWWGWWFQMPSSHYDVIILIVLVKCLHTHSPEDYFTDTWANIYLLQCQTCSFKGYSLVEHSNPITIANMTTQNKMQNRCFLIAWRRHQMESFSVLLAICVGNSPVTGEFPAQRPVNKRPE